MAKELRAYERRTCCRDMLPGIRSDILVPRAFGRSHLCSGLRFRAVLGACPSMPGAWTLKVGAVLEGVIQRFSDSMLFEAKA